NAGEICLRRIERSSVNLLGSGLQLRKVQKISSVERKAFDLLGIDHTRTRVVAALDLRFGRRIYRHDLTYVTHLQRQVRRSDLTNLDLNVSKHRLLEIRS